MAGICDRCSERASQLLDIAHMPEMASVAGLGYRHVCPGCYDDLRAEIGEIEDRDEDRRSEPRVAVSIKARVEGNTSHLIPFSEEMTIDEISRSGLRLRTVREMDQGAILKVAVPDYGLDFTALVEVVWSDDGQHTAGLKLVEASEAWDSLVRTHTLE